jgi:hypothetical protein
MKMDGKNERRLFDIIPGTSIGAINDTVLVNQFQKKEKND